MRIGLMLPLGHDAHLGRALPFGHPQLPVGEEPDERAMAGTPDEIGRWLAGYRERGIGHLIAHVWPRTPDAVALLAEAARVARAVVAEVAPV